MPNRGGKSSSQGLRFDATTAVRPQPPDGAGRCRASPRGDPTIRPQRRGDGVAPAGSAAHATASARGPPLGTAAVCKEDDGHEQETSGFKSGQARR
jgi:hypothetical protein